MVHILTREPLCISLMDWDDKAMAEAVNQTALCALAQIQALVHQEELSYQERLLQINQTLIGIGIRPTMRSPGDGF
jgi:hypothetical protein